MNDAHEMTPSLERPLLGLRYTSRQPLPDLGKTQNTSRDKILAQDEPGDWVHVPCPCGAKDDVALSEIDRHGLPYSKKLCKVCGLLRVDPRWQQDKLDRFYERDYRVLYAPAGYTREEWFEARGKSPHVRDLAHWITTIWGRFGNGKPSPVIVEIGCGGGWNLRNLPSTWQRIGFDVDHAYLKLGREKAHLDLREGFITAALDAVAEADIVLMSYVVEHFSDTTKVLAGLAKSLRNDSLVLIEVPGVLSLHRSDFNFMRFMQNVHLFTFSARTLEAALIRAGFSAVYIDETVRGVFVYAPEKNPDRRPIDQNMGNDMLTYIASCESVYSVLQKVRTMPAGRVVAFLASRFFRTIMQIRFRKLWTS